MLYISVKLCGKSVQITGSSNYLRCECKRRFIAVTKLSLPSVNELILTAVNVKF